MATITGDSYCTEEEETAVIEQLQKAMDGLGTCEDSIIECLLKTNAQRRQISRAFSAAIGKPFDEAIKDELSGDFEEIVLALLREPRELDAVMLHDAMRGIGTNENMLTGVLTTKTNDEIAEIKEWYKKLYDRELADDLNDDTSGCFGRAMFSLCTGFRQEREGDDEYVEKECQKLIDAGVAQLGTKESVFNQVLCLNSLPTLLNIVDKYREMRGAELETDIESEFSGDVVDVYKSILQMARNKADFFATRLYDATVGKFFGTDDTGLIRIVVARSEVDLKDIAEEFEKKYEQSLFDVVASETSGVYKRMLLCLICGDIVPKE